jgi:hypothetical protein
MAAADEVQWNHIVSLFPLTILDLCPSTLNSSARHRPPATDPGDVLACTCSPSSIFPLNKYFRYITLVFENITAQLVIYTYSASHIAPNAYFDDN